MNTSPFPAPRPLSELLADARGDVGQWRQVHEPIDGSTAWDVLTRFTAPAAPVLCLLPAMQTPVRRINPVYTRWAWADAFPEANIVAFSDPALHLDPTVLGGWLMHPELDLTRAAGALVLRIARAWDGEATRILFYGSSMGGFEALNLAATLPGSRALAEVPQLDMLKDGAVTAIDILERHVLGGRTLAEHAADHPEQVSFVARCQAEDYVPAARLVTNMRDATRPAAMELMTDFRLANLAGHGGPMTVDMWPQRLGHAPLPRWAAEPIIAQELTALGAFEELRSS